LQGDTKIDANQLVYEVGGNWFAKLVSVMATRRRATATVMDLQLFPQPDRSTLAICRWDLLPADRAEIGIRIPQGATPLGSWSAGLPATTTVQADRLVVPLNLSRLGQSIELLIRLPGTPPGTAQTLPQLIDIPVKATWLACHDEALAPAPLTTAQGWQRREPYRRALALGASVAEILEGSLDSLAQRPNDEIAAWLLPWLDRADRVLAGIRSDSSKSEGETAAVREAKRNAAVETPAIEPAVQRRDETKIEQRAEAIDRRLEGFTSSVLGTRDVSVYQNRPGRYWFTLASEHHRIGWVAEYQGQATALPAASDVPSPILDDWPLERFAAGWGVLLAGLVVWRFSRRWQRPVGAPAFWLFLIGLAGLLLAPLPVAITVCLIGLAAPWLGWARRGRQR
jgi:hypothetical protein